MPLRLTSAPVAGVQKKRKSSATHAGSTKNRRVPFASHPRTKPGANPDATTSTAVAEAKNADSDLDVPDLPDLGLSRYISQSTPAHNVVQAIRYIQSTMFDDLPATRTGMSSARIAEVLRFRSALPPLASVAHVHTLLDAPTQTEREIVELVGSGVVRRVIVPGRDGDAAGVGDCLVLRDVWEGLVKGCNALGSGVQGMYDMISPLSGYLGARGLWLTWPDKFLHVLRQIGSSSAIPPGVFTIDEYRALVRAGFVVSASSLTKGSLDVAALPNLPSSTASPASRNDQQQQHLPSDQNDGNRFHTATLYVSLPNTGPYLRLLSTTRVHLLSLLRKTPSHSAPLSLLRDKWDGAIESPEKSFHVAKRARGEFAGILPGRTKKWKDLYGVSLRWVLESCLGAGLVEVFETGCVGPGVRAI